jgi:hypothetical protein
MPTLMSEAPRAARSVWIALSAAVIASPLHAQVEGGSILTLLPVDGRTLTLDEEASGALSIADVRGPDDSPMEAWAIEGEAGERVTIDLRAAEFDAYLYLIGPGFRDTQFDDDGAGGCDARLEVTFLEDGTYTVVASSRTSGMGTYTLLATTDPEPAVPFTCGGVDPAILEDLPTEGTIGPGATETGSFDGTEGTVRDERPAEAWLIQGRSGERLRVRLLSEDFDAYLFLLGPGITEVLTDDDSAGNLNSELTIDFPQDGVYRVVASALSGGARGTYTLEVGDPVNLEDLPTDGRQAVVGQTVSGSLSDDEPAVIDGRPGQAWELEGEEGQEVTIELVSEDFDPYLYVVGPGMDLPVEDDDSAGDMDSRVEFEFPESGTYRIIVSAFSSGVGGEFEIRVTAD